MLSSEKRGKKKRDIKIYHMSFRGNEVTVRIKRSEMRLRLDSYVATMLLLGMTYGRFKYSATQTKFGYHRAKMHDIITK